MRGREQRFGDAGRDDCEAGVLLLRDGGEEFMMPQTVPNNPMNGAADPSVARNGRPRFDTLQLTSWWRRAWQLQAGRAPRRSCRLANLPSIRCVRRRSRRGRGRSILPKAGSCFAARFQRADLAIEQPYADQLFKGHRPAHSDAKSSPRMMDFTTMSAWWKRPRMERSREAISSAIKYKAVTAYFESCTFVRVEVVRF